MKYLLAVFCAFFALNAGAEEILSGTYQLTNAPMPVTLAFDANEKRYHGRALNNYFGTYDINENNIAFHAGGSTMMAGLPGDMQAERAYYADLKNAFSYRLENNRLVLTLKDGRELVFEKK